MGEVIFDTTMSTLVAAEGLRRIVIDSKKVNATQDDACSFVFGGEIITWDCFALLSFMLPYLSMNHSCLFSRNRELSN